MSHAFPVIAETAAELQVALADILSRATTMSEQGVIRAGSALGELVMAASASSDGVGEELLIQQDAHRETISTAARRQAALVASYSESVTPLYDTQLALLEEATAALVEVGEFAARISAVSEATRMLQLCTRVEIAHLDKAGSQFRSTVEEMGKLNDVTDELNKTLHELAGSLRDLLPDLTVGARELLAGTKDFETRFNRSLEHVDDATYQLAEMSTTARDQADEDRTSLTAASQDALSALQFQDRMIQDLQRTDSRLGELVVAARGEQAEDTHLSFKANLGDVLDESVPDDLDAPLDDGELLLF